MRKLAIVFAVLAGLFLANETAVAQEKIENWSAPPYWSRVRAHPQGEPALAEAEEPALEPMGGLPTSPLPFTGITPCRIVDTRGLTGSFGGPALAANATRTFDIPSGPCPGIPTDAGAYSLNFTIIGGSGVFTNAFLTAWPTGDSQPTVSTLNFNANQLEANAAVVPAGTSGSINVFVNAPAHLLIDINGYYRGGVVTSINGQTGNVTLTSVGSIIIDPDPDGLFIDVNGGESRLLPAGTANQTLRHNGTSWEATNTLQTGSGFVEITGGLNLKPRASVGSGSLSFLTDAGNGSTLLGLNTFTTGSDNTYLGSAAGGVGSGSGNVAIGRLTLAGLTTGGGNIAIGANVGTGLTTGSNNIYIGNPGSGNESGQIRIGTNGVHTSGTVITSIYGFGSVGGIPVIVNSGGRLGTTTSSARFKEDVRSIGAESDDLMKLRPVAFRYRESHEPGGLKQYGLIAEEVAEIYPELVVNDDEGRPQAIRSQLLDPLLLNEIQKQRREIEALKARLDKLEGKSAP